MNLPAEPLPAAGGLTVTIESALEHQGDLRIRLAGELDGWTAPTLAHALVGLRPPPHVEGQHQAEVMLDLLALTFLDCKGLSALNAGRRELLDVGWLVTAGPAQPNVRWLLRLANRSGWLPDGPLVPGDTSTPPVQVPAARLQQRQPADGGASPLAAQLPGEEGSSFLGRG